VRGPVDVVLGIAHDAEHAANDAQRQHGLQPVKPRHRWEPEKGGRRRRRDLRPEVGGIFEVGGVSGADGARVWWVDWLCSAGPFGGPE
jgi:hypothetical protein